MRPHPVGHHQFGPRLPISISVSVSVSAAVRPGGRALLIDQQPDGLLLPL
ncbi:hypothetical protein [Kitasatospora sp. NPDC091276]